MVAKKQHENDILSPKLVTRGSLYQGTKSDLVAGLEKSSEEKFHKQLMPHAC